MTRVEMREMRRKQFRRDMLLTFFLCVLSFLMGVLTQRVLCNSAQESVQKVDISGSVTIYIVDQTEEKESLPIEEPEQEAEEFKSAYTYTEEELDLLSRLIYSEGGTESYKTKLKIGSVVMNRVEDPDFPDTIREVIYDKNQFSVTTTKINGVIMIDRPADEESKKAAKEVLDHGSILPSDVQVFYADGKCDGNWVTTREVYKVSDKTVFAYIYPKGGKKA